MNSSSSRMEWKRVLKTNPMDCSGDNRIRGKDVICMEEPKMLADRKRKSPRCQSCLLVLYHEEDDSLEGDKYDFLCRMRPIDCVAEETTAATQPSTIWDFIGGQSGGIGGMGGGEDQLLCRVAEWTRNISYCRVGNIDSDNQYRN